MKSIPLSLAVTALLFGIVSCSGEREPETMQEPVIQESAPESSGPLDDTTKFKFDFAIANIPSPASSLQEISAWNVPYDNKLLNDTKKAGQYTTEFEKGINLGIYNIDMAYAMVHESGQDVLQYMKQVMILSDALGLRGAVNSMVGKRAESNINNKDSLFRILDEIFMKSDAYLRTNERVYTAATVFAGSWLESLYLTAKVSSRAADATRAAARRHLWEQRFHLGNLINLLQDYKDKPEISALVEDLRKIHASILKVKQPQDISDAVFNEITGSIEALRTRLVR